MKRIAIVGAGPGGLMLARLLQLRGTAINGIHFLEVLC